MKHDKIHSIIRSHFRLSKRRHYMDNLPISVKRPRESLATLFPKLGLNKGAEVGVKKGAFSKCICEANPKVELYAIDVWKSALQHRADRYYRIARRTLAPFNCTLIKKTSMEAVDDFEDESLDFVYIDANHKFDYVCPDIIFWSRKVRMGGIVSGHDYFNHLRGGVVHAVDGYTRAHNIQPWYVTREIYPSFFWVKEYRN